MAGPRQSVELNEPPRREPGGAELRQHLINASNELYLHELRCETYGRPVTPALRRAHASIKAELRRLDAELGLDAQP